MQAEQRTFKGRRLVLGLSAAWLLGADLAACPATPADGDRGGPAAVTVEQVRQALREAEAKRLDLRQADAEFRQSPQYEVIKEQWGIEVLGLRESARGYMLDFRFRVLDVAKAMPLFDTRVKPYLVPQGTDLKLPVPIGQKVGAFRPTNRGNNIQSGKDYYVMFGNPDAHVKPGGRVSVVIGELRADGLTVK